MAKKPNLQPSPQPARLSPEQMRNGIPRLRKRIEELSQLNLEELTDETGDNVLDSYKTKINDTLICIFGHDTIENKRYHVESLNGYVGLICSDSDNFNLRLPYIKKDVSSCLSKLQAALEILEEKVIEEDASKFDTVLRAYQGLELHPEISRTASKLYVDGHYSNAVEAAVKALNGFVRLRSGLDIDGTALMEKAFSPNSPVLKFNELANQSEKDEQKGFMQMFAGAVCGLRNPRAHGFLKDDPERALEFIAFVSLLAKLLDEAKT